MTLAILFRTRQMMQESCIRNVSGTAKGITEVRRGVWGVVRHTIYYSSTKRILEIVRSNLKGALLIIKRLILCTGRSGVPLQVSLELGRK